MAEKETQVKEAEENKLESGPYEIIRKRLSDLSSELDDKLSKLNNVRKEVFGSIENKLIETTRITTENNCTPRDIISIGNYLIFGYNVFIGLKSQVELEDVFSIYEYNDRKFKDVSTDFINDPAFITDFQNLYKYYKSSRFSKFSIIGSYLFMVFNVGKRASDIKTFKWQISDDKLVYLDNRSDSEFKFPDQHEFKWTRVNRDHFRQGEHSHISILDRIFVETIGGDLTIKIEDNTKTGEGIYSEEVVEKNQTLDDADIYYSDLGNIILLKIKPYQEEDFRYIVYNSKIHQATRIDAIKDACVLLPDNQGLIFSDGFYLQTGEYKRFEHNLTDMVFEKRIFSQNGEDFLYTFFNREDGNYVLLSYNIIKQKVDIPITCNGYSFFENGELIYFKANGQAQKHHSIQIWQTAFVGEDYALPVTEESYVYKIGNKELVRGMSECYEIKKLITREDSYNDLYVDITKKAGELIDLYFWLDNDETFNLKETLEKIKNTATTALEEFAKVLNIRENTKKAYNEVKNKAKEIVREVKLSNYKEVNEFVQTLSRLRNLRGEIIALKELRYINLQDVEKIEEEIITQSDNLSESCTVFLLKESSLAKYEDKAKDISDQIHEVRKGSEAKQIETDINDATNELELLIEIINNLKIDDPTKTAKIIENISKIFTKLNKSRAELKIKRKDIDSAEATNEFQSQISLLNQGLINFLDISDTPEKCEEYQTKLIIQIEELEGKFIDFDEFTLKLTEKQEEIYNAFESRKLAIIDSRNKRANSLMDAAERIMKGIRNRASKFSNANEINAFFASDMMIEKIRDIVDNLVKLEDNIKADDVQTKLKTIKEDTLRQLTDRNELFVDGENVISLGEHKFTVNVQNLDISLVQKENEMYYHINGSNFFEKIEDDNFMATKEIWNQDILSENEDVYRAEYLAYKLLNEFETDKVHDNQEIVDFMSSRYDEGYVKGVHDSDTGKILNILRHVESGIGLLSYPPIIRACASIFWSSYIDKDLQEKMSSRLEALEDIDKIFQIGTDSAEFARELEYFIEQFINETKLFPLNIAKKSSEYLCKELASGKKFNISREAADFHEKFFEEMLHDQKIEIFKQSISKLDNDRSGKFRVIIGWLSSFASFNKIEDEHGYIYETAALIFNNNYDLNHILDISLNYEIHDMLGEHNLIQKGIYNLDYLNFTSRLENFEKVSVKKFKEFTSLKKNLAEEFYKSIRIDEFKPRVLSSFVRNKLIDKVYLPIIGNNLAKQIGAEGDTKRTDRMGLLLLISPPGYGKTTLMEYVASRLGIIFVKINGPAIGHKVVSLDPEEANNSAAKDEINKLSIALEMGDNIMIYLDDIQHLNPEFLQKFISLTDAQRKIEAVYKGSNKRYDLRGKKVAVVMAGNPYTESGERFTIPDMLANRADIYNIGDMIGDFKSEFELSYLENSLTSNSTLIKLSNKSKKDVYSFIKMSETGERENISFEASYSNEEINEIISVFQKMNTIRDVILKVNKMYIESASQSDQYRTEPAFKLQGSYRDMNKLAEKVFPIMNDEELNTLILSHYEQESQTLTSDAEANLLKFKELIGIINQEEKARWEDIKATFMKNKKYMGIGSEDRIGQVMAEISGLSDGLDGIRKALEGRSK